MPFREAPHQGGTAAVHPRRHRWYLVGFDIDRDDWRIFRVDRISGSRSTGTRNTPRPLPAADVAAYVTARMLEMAPVHRAVATVYAPVEQVAARLGDTPTELEPIDAGSCRLHSHTDTLEWLAWRLLTLGYDFDVHEPPELIAHLREIGARATRAAGRPPARADA